MTDILNKRDKNRKDGQKGDRIPSMGNKGYPYFPYCHRLKNPNRIVFEFL